jgi:hypothetical protein
VQLHLHTEWADEARVRLLEHVTEKRQHIRHFSLDEQETLIRAGAALIESAGGGRPTAFRAGSFALNLDTLTALARCGICIDSSYNACGSDERRPQGRPLHDVTQMTVSSIPHLRVYRRLRARATHRSARARSRN